MKVRILKTAAGPDGTFIAGSVLVGPPEAFTGLAFEVLEADPVAKAVELAEAAPVVQTTDAAPHVAHRPAAKRGSRK